MIRTQLDFYIKTPNDIQKEYLESVIKSFYGYKRFGSLFLIWENVLVEKDSHLL